MIRRQTVYIYVYIIVCTIFSIVGYVVRKMIQQRLMNAIHCTSVITKMSQLITVSLFVLELTLAIVGVILLKTTFVNLVLANVIICFTLVFVTVTAILLYIFDRNFYLVYLRWWGEWNNNKLLFIFFPLMLIIVTISTSTQPVHFRFYWSFPFLF